MRLARMWKKARLVMVECRKIINQVNEIKEGQSTVPQELQTEMRSLLTELEAKVRQGAQVEAIGESSMEANMSEWI